MKTHATRAAYAFTGQNLVDGYRAAHGRSGLRACSLVTILVPVLLAWACTRHAEVGDESDPGQMAPNTTPKAGDVPMIDSGLDTDAFPACSERRPGACIGLVDFPCAFEKLVEVSARQCQERTGCQTNGWLRVRMGSEGCVVGIGMEHPNDAIVACLLNELGTVQCPCGRVDQDYFFGLGHGGDHGVPCSDEEGT